MKDLTKLETKEQKDTVLVSSEFGFQYIWPHSSYSRIIVTEIIRVTFGVQTIANPDSSTVYYQNLWH